MSNLYTVVERIEQELTRVFESQTLIEDSDSLTLSCEEGNRVVEISVFESSADIRAEVVEKEGSEPIRVWEDVSPDQVSSLVA